MTEEIYPETYKTKHYCFFADTCSECGALHPYRKYAGGQKRNHIAKCFPNSTQGSIINEDRD